MKRFLVGILGIFLLFGASLLTACGKDKPRLTLSQDTVAIQLYSENEDSGYQIVTADLSGVKEGSIRATVASGYENIVKITTTNSSSTRTSIKIEGLEEGNAQIVVKATPGDITKYIYVTVYSEVSSMSQVVEESGKKNNFLVLGEDNILDENKLISFYPVKGRKTITWSLHDNYVDNPALELNGNVLHIDDTFVGDGENNTLTLVAKTEKDVMTEVTLPVIKKINTEFSLGFSYSKNSSFENITAENNEFNIVPNIPTDDKYEGYILVGYTGNLEIKSYVLDENGNESNDLQVLSAGIIDNMPLYSVYASKDKSNINGNYKIGFRIGYAKYNYYLDTIDSYPINIKAREMVNGIIVSTTEVGNIGNSTQTLYTSYVESSSTSVNGKRYDISITPTTVIDATNKYSISVSRTVAGGAVSEGCPVEVWYRDALNGDAWTQIVLVPSSNGDYVTREEDLPSVKTLYLKASSKIKDQTVDGFRMTFTSADNTNISTSFDLKLVKSVSLGEFAFDNANFRVDSSVSSVVSKKQFTLKGQTSIEGLYIINNSTNVVFDPIREVSFDAESVTFEVSFVLTKTGITSKDTYQIAHRNGLVAGPFDIDIFLPLKFAGMFLDSGENQSNSVIDSALNNKVYTTGGLVADDAQIASLSKLILKNNTTTPLLYTYNSIAGKSAVADISVAFFDYDSELETLEQFQGLMSSPEGINRVIRGAIEKGDSSNIAYFNSNYSAILTKGVGHTYAVISFTGKGIENVDEDGNVVFVRVVYLESLVTPEGFNVVPESDKNISLYSLNTVATEDEELTRKQITIKFVKSDITYNDLSNLEFVSRSTLMGNQEVSPDRGTVTWSDGRYSISNITINGEGISFNVLALDTFGDDIFTDTLSLHYMVKDLNGKKIYDIFIPFSIVIRNAQRVESITWKSYREDGLYFEVGNKEPQYVLIDTAPTNAKNTNLAYIIKAEGSGNSNTFVEVNPTVSSTTLAINLSDKITKGMSGYVYILPADAIYNHQIKYYYMEGGKEKSGTISDNDLPNNYEYLVANAYFKSNATGGDAKIVKFADILIRIKVQVADGKSFDYAYRIYDVDSFVSMRHDRYYTIMNDIDLTNATERGVDASSSLTGGIQGKNDTITIKLDGSNLAKVLGSNGIVDSSAEIRNITFVGNVTGGGFVAEENKGKITNVTVDVNGTKASTLVSTTSVGGIVGTNNGTISGVSVLGLDINADGQNVGGIAGVNNGTITGSRVEFYNLEKDSEYSSNKFYGANVGGIVGVIGNGSKIERTYAYDYTLVPRYTESSNASQNALQNVLKSSQSNGGVGAFAGRYANNFTNAVINYSFSVVNAMVNVGGSSQNGLTTTSTYISYYTGLNYNTTASQNDINFVKENETGFKSYVNNGNPHLKELMQDEPVSSVAGYDVVSYSDNGFYKSLAVNEVVEERGKGLLFRYDILNESNELSSSEQIDLDALNTITLADLVGEQNVSRNIIVTSSNSSIVKVVGSTLQILKNGNITLTISSKQDVKNKKEIDVNVIYALSDLMISWTSASGKVSYVEDETTLILQKTHSRTYITNLENSQIYLGNLAKAFEIKPNNGSSLNIKLSGDDKNKLVKIDESNVTNAGFRVITDTNSIQTRFIVSPKIYNEENAYQKAIETQFKRTFTIDPIDGVILFNISGDALPITPSTNATLEVQIKTTQENDTVYPVIEYNDTKLVSTPVEKNIYNYTLPSQSTPIFTATINKIDSLPSKDTESNLKTYVYLITFAVNADYQSLVSEDMEFNVYIMSESGNSSRDWNGEFKLSLTRQNFTNIDVSNRKITNSSYRYEEGGSGRLVEVHEANLPTAVLAPGNSSVLQINVNPEFAYYDYVDLSYSDATVSEAVNMEVLTKYGNDLFTRKPLSGNNIETIGSALRYYPEIGEKGTLYYKLWINTTVNRDSVLKFTAKFYEAGGKLITYVNYYLTVSYLTEPKVTIDDATTSYVAKGSNATVKIDVLIDQKIDNLLLDGEDMSGISLAPQGEPVPDLEKGIKTYTTTLYVSPTATVKNNLCYVQAEVSRELNGSKEKKTAVATAVIVDFKVDGNNIVFDNSADGNVTIWQGVTKPISINYNLIPENYPNASDEDTEAAINDLREKRAQFTSSQLYPVKIISDENNIVYEPISGDELDNYNYFVNYRYNKIGNDIYDDNKDDNVLIPLKLRDRLYVVSGNNRYPLVEKDSEIDIPFVPIYDDETNTVSFRGIRQSSPVTLVLMTYISAGGFTQEIETFFNVTVDAYSDPDIPLLVKNAKDFKNLAPGQNTSTSVQDYILTSDIVLQNYTAFDTSLIRSLDGNGHTIFIDSFNTDDTGVLNLALFTTVRENTTLKNIRVNLYNGGQLSIDTSVHKEINIAGLAIENEGVITNCEVVSFYTNATAKGDVEGVDDFNYPAISVKHNNPTGINVEYTNGMGSDPIKLVDASDWTSQVAGFVINNMGSITNSRVGGDSVIIIGEDKVVNGEPTGYTYASSAQLDTFNIIGQGNISGFVISNNNGNIAACFAKNINMVNESDSTSFYSTGFVGTNTSTINVSYVEGVPSEPSDDKNSGYSVFANEGSSISSEKGYISGFAYSNEGTIKDSYSNILIASAEVSKKVYLASGFVYSNSGVIENGYSASQIKNSTSTQMNFSGVNNKGELLADGEYINCYFFNKLYEGSEESSDNSTETQNSTGAMLVPMPDEASSFYGFAIANSDNDGVWKIEDGKGITLVSANTIATSHRYIYYVDDSIFQGSAAEDDKGKYILPYAILTFTDENREIDTSLGGYNNPIIIVDAQDFVEVTGTTTSSYIKKYFNNTAVWGTYRLVNDINLQDVASGDNVVILPTATKAFSGNFYGNGFTISGLSISSVDPATSLGLFRSIEKRGKLSNPIVENLNIEVTQIEGTVVVMTGALAGYIKDAVVINIDIQFAENATVTGLNFVGGLSGFVFGNNIIKCINVENPNVIAKANPIDDNRANYFISDESKSENSLQNLRIEVINSLNLNTSVESEFIKNLKNYSYAGGVIGFADLFSSNDSMFDILQSENFNINNVRVSGTVRVEGQIAGGAFGLTGYQTNIRDVGVTIDGGSPSKIFSTRYFAGGVIGQSFGSISRVYSVYDETTQDEIENGMADFYNGNYDTERGNLDIFYTKGTDYTQQYIGGIAGAVFSGNIEVSYSKLNVTSPTATYAGGIFGALDLRNANAYQKEIMDDTPSIFTGYYLNEVFATGDVRANTETGFAGGIVGVIIGNQARTVFNSVNAYNYFTAYDYNTETYREEIYQGDITEYNFSELYKFNVFVGQFATDVLLNDVIVDDTVGLVKEDENGKLTIDPPDQYISFIRKKDNEGKTVATVSYYESYYKKDNNKVTMNLFGKINGMVDEDKNPLFRDGLVYAIESPSEYTNAIAGSQYTNIGFLGSGVWTNANWEHKAGKLFISIKYKRSSDILYLDAYKESIEAVFQAAKGYKIIYVRGLESAGSEKYTDIDLVKYYNEEAGTYYIEGFAGLLKGGIYPLESATKVKIITDRPFIKQVNEGFKAVDVEVEYSGYKASPIEIKKSDESGLFIANKAQGIEIEGLTMDIKSPITYTLSDGNANFNVGLVAPELERSRLSGINIIGNTSETLLSIKKLDEASGNPGAGQTLNVGLIAGIAEQNSVTSLMQINAVTITALGNLISIDSLLGCENYNIGGYFGIARKTSEAGGQNFTIALDNLSKSSDATEEFNKILFTKENVEASNVNIGGYIGLIGGDESNISGITSISITKKIKTAVQFLIGLKVSNLNVGGYIGNYNNSGANGGLSIEGMDSDIDAGLFVYNPEPNSDTLERIISTLNAGGIVGKSSQGLTISSFNNIEFGAIGYINELYTSKLTTQQEDLDGNYYETPETNYYNIKVSNEANIGGIVGRQTVSIDIKDIKTINGQPKDYIPKNRPESAKIENAVNSFRVDGRGSAKVRMGSMIGNFSGSTLSIINTETFNSYTEFSVLNASNTLDGAIIGGFVGNAEIKNSSSILNSSENLYARYLGAVYSNTKNLIFGGVIGRISVSDSNPINEQQEGYKGSLSIAKTVFGGVVKVFGEKSKDGEITTGGTIGLENGDKDTAKSNNAIQLINNYNFGDVFVEYSNETNFTKLKTYNFGGLIGKTTNIAHVIQDNYSIMTSHNSKYSTVTDTAHALYGNGIPMAAEENPISKNNYYNHAMVLANDEHGIDLPLSKNFEANQYKGYNTNGAEALSITSKMLGVINDIVGFGKSKLSLGVINVTEEEPENSEDIVYKYKKATLNTADTFHGMKYYSMSSAFDILKVIEGGQEVPLNNIALIGGNGETLDSSKFTVNGSVNSMISEMTGHSFVSGFAINVDIEHTNSNEKSYVAPLISQMTGNSILYAVNVKGTLDYATIMKGGNVVSGLVGVLRSGRIFDCSTDIDIIYRANKNIDKERDENNNPTPQSAYVGVYGITKFEEMPEEGNDKHYSRIVENTYSSGSIKTYITSNVYAFSNSDVSVLVNNCYAIPKLDLNDYTVEDNSVATAKIGVFGINGDTATGFTNCYYDVDAFNFTGFTTAIGTAKTHSELMGTVTTDEQNNITYSTNKDNFKINDITDIKWVSDYDFNYGYPTLKYDYLKPSSYSILESYKTKLQRLEGKGNDYVNENNYDNYVIENEYKRLPNGEKPENNNIYKKGEVGSYFFMITNPALFSKMNVNKSTKSGDTITQTNEGIISPNYILKYSLDLGQIGSKTNYNNAVYLSAPNVSLSSNIVFDGQNNNINNLANTLFSELKGKSENEDQIPAIIMNINIEFNTNVAKNAILALKAIDTLISNVSITGDLNSSNIKTGGFVTELINSEINTSTSLINISNDSDNNVAVGGFAGVMSGNSKILFSSNYGPINAYASADQTGITTAVGGLVGLMLDKSCVINYSYNASSVLNNYATSSNVCNTRGLFFTGGIVGYARNGNINNSYNSGIVKSGNKNNIDLYDKGLFDNKKDAEVTIGGIAELKVNYTSASYAGGIMGFIYDGAINNCYNEGNVEALGQNPKTEWKWDNNSNLILKQSANSKRNVFAYGIGYAYKTNWFGIQNASIENISTEYDKESRLIYANGTALEGENVIKEWAWDDIIETNGLNVSESYSFSASMYRFEPAGLANWSKTFNSTYTATLLSCAEDSVKKLNREDKSAEVVVKSRDDLGIPVDFSVRIKRLVEFKYKWDQRIDGFIYAVFFLVPFWNSASYAETNLNPNTIEITDYYYGQVKNEPYLDLIITDDASKNTNASYRNDESFSKENIKSSTRSGESSEDLSDISKIQIDGKTFIIADKNNNTDIFNSGINTKTGTITVDTIDKKDEHNQIITGMPYLADLSYYSIKVENNKTISSNITSITPKRNKDLKGTDSYIEGIDDETVVKMDIGYILLSQEKIESTTDNPIKLKLILNYSETITFDIDNLKYYYVDDYSFAFKHNSLNPLPVNKYKLKYHNGEFEKNTDGTFKLDSNGEKIPIYNTYETVIRISKKKIENLDEEKRMLKDSNDNFLYLAVVNENGLPVEEDKNNKYIYIPNATLETPDGEIKVNITENKDIFEYSEDLTSEEKSNKFANDVQIAIKEIANHTYYNRIYSGIEFYRSVTPNKSGQSETLIGGSFEGSIPLDYGEEISGNNIVESVSKSGSNNFTIKFKPQESNVVGINKESTGVVSYDSVNEKWNANNSYTIMALKYEFISSSQNTITLRSTTPGSENAVKNYFTGLTYIRDNWDKEQIISKVSNVNTNLQNISGATDSITLSGDFSKEWTVGGKTLTKNNTGFVQLNNNFKARTQDNGNELIVLLKNKPTANITHSGVGVYRGTQSLGNVTETSISNITNITIKRKDSAVTHYYWKITDRNNTILKESSSNTSFTGIDQSFGNMGTFRGAINIYIQLYATFVKEETEADEMLVGFDLSIGGSTSTYYVDAAYKDGKTTVSNFYKLIKGVYGSGGDIIVENNKGNINGDTAFLIKSVVTKNYSSKLLMMANDTDKDASNEYEFDRSTGKIKKGNNDVPYDVTNIKYNICIIHDGLIYEFPFVNYSEDFKLTSTGKSSGYVESDFSTEKSKIYSLAKSVEVPEGGEGEDSETQIPISDSPVIKEGEDIPVPYFDLSNFDWKSNFNVNEILKNADWESLKIKFDNLTKLYDFSIDSSNNDYYKKKIGENFLAKGSHSVSGREKEYIYINSNAKVTGNNEIKWYATGEGDTLSSLTKVKDVTYVSFKTSKYQTVTENFSVNASDHELIIEGNRDFDNTLNWIRQGQNVKYTREGNSFTVYLRKKDVASIDIKSKITSSWSAELEEISVEITEKQSIILARNITFNKQTNFAKSAGVNIVGNGHFISYIGDAFYSTAFSPKANESTWIRDVKYLGEMSGKKSFFTYEKMPYVEGEAENAGENNILLNVSFYGSMINWQEEILNEQDTATDESIKYSAALINNKMNLKNVTTYVGITKSHYKTVAPYKSDGSENSYKEQTKYKNVYLFNEIDSTSSISNYGVVIADYGDIGDHGLSGGYNTEAYKEAKGHNGTDGGSIVASKQNELPESATLTIENHGILINGVGGSGGAGGNAENGGSEYIDVTGGFSQDNNTGNIIGSVDVGGTVNANNGSGGLNGISIGFRETQSNGIVVNRVQFDPTSGINQAFSRIDPLGVGEKNNDYRSQSGSVGRASFKKIMALLPVAQTDSHTWGSTRLSFYYNKKDLSSRDPAKGENSTVTLLLSKGVTDLGGLKNRQVLISGDDAETIFCKNDGVLNLDAPNGLTYGVRLGQGIDSQGMLYRVVCRGDNDGTDYDDYDNFKYTYRYFTEPNSKDGEYTDNIWKYWKGVKLDDLKDQTFKEFWQEIIDQKAHNEWEYASRLGLL